MDGKINDLGKLGRNSQVILFAGYSRSNYVDSIREFFPRDEFQIGCFYNRPPSASFEREFVSNLDFTLDVSRGFEPLEKIAQDREVLITHTRERDSNLYIEGMFRCGLINNRQRTLYNLANDKLALNLLLQNSFPSTVPEIYDLSRIESGFFPLIVKPTGLCGSIFTKIVHSAEQLSCFVSRNARNIANVGRREFGRDVSFMAQEFIQGEQYSVNCYVNSLGHPIPCPIVRVTPAFEMGIDDTYSAFQYVVDEFPEGWESGLLSLLEKITDLLEIRNISAHFDVVRSIDGWKLLDMGLRVGSLRQQLFYYSNSMNHIANDLFNRKGVIPSIPKRSASACIVSKASPQEGVLKEIRVANLDRLYSDVFSDSYDIKIDEIGKWVRPVSFGGKKLTKHIVVGKDFNEVLEDSKYLFDSISFNVDCGGDNERAS